MPMMPSAVGGRKMTDLTYRLTRSAFHSGKAIRPMILVAHMITSKMSFSQKRQRHNSCSQRTIIFCMDSLNGNHRSALVRINEYLQEAAKDKKGVLDPHQAKIQKVMMPKQPNSYDCGLYMLHFAQCFVSNPEKYIGSIFVSISFSP